MKSKEEKKQYLKEYYLANKDKIKSRSKNRYEKNKEEILEKQKKYYYKNPEKRRASTREYYRKNKEKKQLTDKKYRENNKEKIRLNKKKYIIENQDKVKKARQIYYQKNKEEIKRKSKKWSEKNIDRRRKRQSEYDKNRRKTDVGYRISKSLRLRVRDTLKGRIKSIPTMKLVGCSIEECKSHLESKFKPGMTWENYGVYGWHIDHIKPCASFDLTDPEQQRKCFHYTNLQPLWAKENYAKGSKIIGKK